MNQEADPTALVPTDAALLRERLAREKAEGESRSIREAEERKAAQAKREAAKLAKASDATKIRLLADYLRAYPLPETTSLEAKNLLDTIHTRVSTLTSWIDREASELE